MKKRWIKFFYEKMMLAASMSRDENTHVGAVAFNEEDKVELSSGYNDLPRNVKHTKERNSRPMKYKWTAHAEQNCIANAARMGVKLNGASIMVSMYPCTTCAAMLINAGIKKVYAPLPNFLHEQYGREFKISEEMFLEAGVVVEVI